MILKLMHEYSYRRRGNRRIYIFTTAAGISASLLTYWFSKKKQISNDAVCEVSFHSEMFMFFIVLVSLNNNFCKNQDLQYKKTFYYIPFTLTSH